MEWDGDHYRRDIVVWEWTDGQPISQESLEIVLDRADTSILEHMDQLSHDGIVEGRSYPQSIKRMTTSATEARLPVGRIYITPGTTEYTVWDGDATGVTRPRLLTPTSNAGDWKNHLE